MSQPKPAPAPAEMPTHIANAVSEMMLSFKAVVKSAGNLLSDGRKDEFAFSEEQYRRKSDEIAFGLQLFDNRCDELLALVQIEKQMIIGRLQARELVDRTMDGREGSGDAAVPPARQLEERLAGLETLKGTLTSLSRRLEEACGEQRGAGPMDV